ncbi:hypothetical protein [Roseateles sp.]
MSKTRIEGGAEQGERACDRKALVIKASWRKCGGRAVKMRALPEDASPCG